MFPEQFLPLPPRGGITACSKKKLHGAHLGKQFLTRWLILATYSHHRYKGQSTVIYCMCMYEHQSSNVLVTGARDKLLRIYDTRTTKVIWQLNCFIVSGYGLLDWSFIYLFIIYCQKWIADCTIIKRISIFTFETKNT